MQRLLLTAVIAWNFIPSAYSLSAEKARPVADAGPIRFAADDWPWWRGPTHDGVARADQQVPLKWSETENVLWKVAVPGRGHGSPTVVGNQVFLATADYENEIQSVLCFDRRTGERLWQTEIHRGEFEKKGNKKSSLASATVACDGERVFINFLHAGAIYTTALDRDGKQLWQTKITDYVEHQGYGSSPTVYQSLVLVSADNKGGRPISSKPLRPHTSRSPRTIWEKTFTPARRSAVAASTCAWPNWRTASATRRCIASGRKSESG